MSWECDVCLTWDERVYQIQGSTLPDGLHLVEVRAEGLVALLALWKQSVGLRRLRPPAGWGPWRLVFWAGRRRVLSVNWP